MDYQQAYQHLLEACRDYVAYESNQAQKYEAFKVILEHVTHNHTAIDVHGLMNQQWLDAMAADLADTYEGEINATRG